MNNTLSSLAGDHMPYRPAGAQPAAPAVPLADMNEAVQRYLAGRQQQVQAFQAIIRYDRLPHVAADAPAVDGMVRYIFSSILDHPPAGTRLFIYIKCEKEKTEIMDLSLPEGWQRFEVSVYTNIVADEAWQQAQQPVLAGLRDLIEKASGTFASFNIANTGCLYQMVLPGKYT